LKKLLITIAVIALLVVGGIYIYLNWRHDFIRRQVPKLVFLQSDSLYKISYDDVYIDEINGEIKVQNLRFTPDTTFKQPGDSTLPRQLLDVFVPELHITGVHTDQALLNKEIIASKIQLSRPQITMYSNPRGNNSEKKERLSTPDLYRVILRKLDKIKIDTILIDSAEYTIAHWAGKDTVLTASSINGQLLRLNISDSTSTDTSRVLFSEQAGLNIKNIIIRDRKGMYNFKFDSIQIQSTEKRFTVKNVFIVPLLSEKEFMRVSKWQTDRFNFDFTDVGFNNVNVQELLQGNLIADSLVIGKGLIKIYRDLSYERKNESKVGNYPHQLLLRAPMDVSLKTVRINNAYIEYKEKNPKSDSSGKVAFANVHATLHNVTNRDEDIAGNAICTLNFHSSFLSRAPLVADLSMYLKDPQGKFAIKGTLSGTDATLFNQLTRPMGLASIDEGRINRLDFNLAGNDNSAYGTVRLLYDNLKVTLLKKDENNEYKKKGFASLLANVAIKNANPQPRKAVRIATVSYKRDAQKSFFNLLWKSIFVGVKESVGISQ
jgi:hypothetical protein